MGERVRTLAEGGGALKARMRTLCFPGGVLFFEVLFFPGFVCFSTRRGVDLSSENIPQGDSNRLVGRVTHALHSD